MQVLLTCVNDTLNIYGRISQNDAQDDVIRSSHALHHAFARRNVTSGKSHALD